MNLIENAVRLAIQQAYVRLMAMPRLVRGQTPSKVVNQVKEVQSMGLDRPVPATPPGESIPAGEPQGEDDDL